MITAGMPLTIGTRTAKNRITMAPTVKFFAGEDGLMTDFFVRHYEARAKGGCGLICVEATAVAPEGRLYPSQPGLWNDAQIAGHARIAEACHRHGALIIPQLHYGGLGTHPACGPLTSPTQVVWNDGDRDVTAKELSLEEILRVERDFVDAALRAKAAGYDGVQLHGCHAYLINDFASAVNRRTDRFGGSVENMARFGCDIIRGIRAECGTDFIISMRASGCDPDPDAALEVMEHYVNAGCDMLQISCGIGPFDGIPYDEKLPYNRIAALGVRVHGRFAGRVPVSCVNGIRTPELARYMIENGLVDAVDLACGVLADPAFAEAILTDAPHEPCRNCRVCGWGPVKKHYCPASKARGVNEWES